MSVHDRTGRLPGMTPSAVLSLWLRLTLLTLPGWRVPGQAFDGSGSIRCPFDHGWAELRNGDRGAYCSAQQHGWFTWAVCPQCRNETLATTIGADLWLCDNPEHGTFAALRCTAIDCSGVALPAGDDRWVCATTGTDVLQSFGGSCQNCRRGRAILRSDRSGGNCSTCGQYAAYRG